MEIKNIVFDFGGVLMDWNPRYVYREVFETEKEMEYFLSEICNSTWNHKQDEGRSFSAAVEEKVREFPKYEKEIRMYQSHWIHMISGDIPENSALVPELKSKYTLYGLTNWSAETFPLVRYDYSFFQELKGIVVSGEERVAKPDPEIYRILLRRYELDPSTCLFIDDVKDNINTALDLGFNCIHLPEGTNLREELVKRNLL